MHCHLQVQRTDRRTGARKRCRKSALSMLVASKESSMSRPLSSPLGRKEMKSTIGRHGERNRARDQERVRRRRQAGSQMSKNDTSNASEGCRSDTLGSWCEYEIENGLRLSTHRLLQRSRGELSPLRHILRARQAAFRAPSQRWLGTHDLHPGGRQQDQSLEELAMLSALLRRVPKRLPSLMSLPVIAVVEEVNSPSKHI